MTVSKYDDKLRYTSIPCNKRCCCCCCLVKKNNNNIKVLADSPKLQMATFSQCPHRERRREASCLQLFIRALIPSWDPILMKSSTPNHLPKAPPTVVLPIWRALPHLREADWALACDLASLLPDVFMCAPGNVRRVAPSVIIKMWTDYHVQWLECISER